LACPRCRIAAVNGLRARRVQAAGPRESIAGSGDWSWVWVLGAGLERSGEGRVAAQEPEGVSRPRAMNAMPRAADSQAVLAVVTWMNAYQLLPCAVTIECQTAGMTTPNRPQAIMPATARR
jgi:hypothetical protein